MQKELLDFDKDKKADVGEIQMGVAVRNANYRMIYSSLPLKRQKVFEVILSHTPDGVTSKEIRNELGWGIQSISGRVSELHQSDPPLIESCGIKLLPDYEGKVHPNNLWRAIF